MSLYACRSVTSPSNSWKGEETIQQDELSHESNDVMTGRTGSDAVADGVCFYVSE